MSQDWLPALFFPAFVALWIGVVFLVATIGGWRSLAERYVIEPAQYTGTRWHMRSGVMRGTARYGNVLTIGADRRGLFLSILFLFRVGHPPLFIPWEHIEMRERRGWLFTYVDFIFKAVPGVQLTVSRKLADEVAREGGRQIA
ncbi:MAG TPA: hypothetical protein VGQ36_03870 [Thermoanaerobaculia bacterium]|jgi:hypothetical protein|nr:hypothetical protein [Thermoanaerobaculia bacterium]